jgi:hypothetical protein
MGVENPEVFAKKWEISKNLCFGVPVPRGRFLTILTPPWHINFLANLGRFYIFYKGVIFDQILTFFDPRFSSFIITHFDIIF